MQRRGRTQVNSSEVNFTALRFGCARSDLIVTILTCLATYADLPLDTPSMHK